MNDWERVGKGVLQWIAAGMLLAGLTQASVETIVIIGLVVIGVVVAHRVHKKRKRQQVQESAYVASVNAALQQRVENQMEDAYANAFRQAWIEPAEMTIARIDAVLNNEHEPIISYVTLYNEVKRLTGENRAYKEQAEGAIKAMTEMKYGKAIAGRNVEQFYQTGLRDLSWGSDDTPRFDAQGYAVLR